MTPVSPLGRKVSPLLGREALTPDVVPFVGVEGCQRPPPLDPTVAPLDLTRTSGTSPPPSFAERTAVGVVRGCET